MHDESDNPAFDHLINNMDSDEVVPPKGCARDLDARVSFLYPIDGESLPALLRRTADAVEGVELLYSGSGVSHVQIEWDSAEGWSALLVVEA